MLSIRCSRSDDCAVQSHVFFDHRAQIKHHGGAFTSRSAQRFHHGRIFEHPAQTDVKSIWVAGHDLQTGFSNHFTEATDFGGYHDLTSHHLLDGGKTGRFLPNRRHNYHLKWADCTVQIRSRKSARKADRRGKIQAPRFVFEIRSERTVADNCQVKSEAVILKTLRCFQKDRYALFGNKPPNVANFETMAILHRRCPARIANAVQDRLCVWECDAATDVIGDSDIHHRQLAEPSSRELQNQ